MKRLEAIYSFVEPGQPLWDIGCDHGELGLRALKENRVPHVFFVDKSRSVTERLEEIMPLTLKGRSTVRRAHAEHLKWGEVTGTVVLAGLGAATIVRILETIPTGQREQIKLVLCSERGLLEDALTRGGWQVTETVECQWKNQRRTVLAARPLR